MKHRIFTSSMGARKPSIVHAIKEALEADSFSSLSGCESYDEAIVNLSAMSTQHGLDNNLREFIGGLSPAQKVGVTAAIVRPLSVPDALMSEAKQFAKMNSLAGLEGFSQAMEPGKTATLKAASIALNALSHCKTEAAEEMFKTVVLSDDEEQFSFSVRTAGLGRYIFGASAFDSASQLRPVLSLLRDGEMFIDDTLKLNPVWPTEASAPERSLFVDEADFAPWVVPYSNADAMQRKEHMTNFLKVGVNVPNLLGLSEVPGQRPFDSSSDEIESNSIRVKRVLVRLKIGDEVIRTTVNATAFTNNNFGPSSNVHSSDDRQLNMRVNTFPATAFERWDDAKQTFVPDERVASLNTADYEVMFRFSATGTFWRQGYSIETQAGALQISYITNAEGARFSQTSDNAATKAIYASVKEAQVIGFAPTYNHNNLNRTNFGYRIEVYDTMKHLATRLQTPISVKYPVSKEDVNQAALQDAMDHIIVTLQANTTNATFKAARDHIELVTKLNGSAIVGNEQSSNTMAGMHFVNATALHRTIKMADSVSVQENVNLLDNVAAMFTANVTEIAAALETNSTIAAINEYRKVEVKWIVVGHQNLARYVFKPGDARTLGAGVSFRTVRTNLDSMIGKFYIFPESETTDTNIDVIGGMGVMVSKEHRVFQADVTRNNADFGIMVTIPSYELHSVCPIVGTLTVSDAHEALTETGLINYLTAVRVKLIDKNGETYKAGGAAAGGDAPTDDDTDVGDLP